MSDIRFNALDLGPSVASRASRAWIKHHIPGRLRLEIPRAVGKAKLIEKYAAALTAVPGCVGVEARVATGSVVLRYDPSCGEAVLQCVEECCESQNLSLTPASEPEVHTSSQTRAELLAEHSELSKGLMVFFNGLDIELKTISNNTVDLNIALVGGLAVFTLMGIGAASATPMWVTLALYGINHAVALQSESLHSRSLPTNPLI